jgi:hypothetical protein
MHGCTLYNLHKRVIDSDHKNVTGALQLLVVDVAGDVRVGARWTYEGLEIAFDIMKVSMYSLKAAGTPMIKAFPLIASLKLTLLPGELSTRTSRFGSLSPTLMKARAELWKFLGREALSASRRSAIVEAIIEYSQLLLEIEVRVRWRSDVDGSVASSLVWLGDSLLGVDRGPTQRHNLIEQGQLSFPQSLPFARFLSNNIIAIQPVLSGI